MGGMPVCIITPSDTWYVVLGIKEIVTEYVKSVFSDKGSHW